MTDGFIHGLIIGTMLTVILEIVVVLLVTWRMSTVAKRDDAEEL